MNFKLIISPHSWKMFLMAGSLKEKGRLPK